MSYTPPDEVILIDIQNSARRILRFTKSLSYESFLDNEIVVLAVQHQFIVLGEAVKRLSPAFREANPRIPWSRVAGLRDTLVHHYDEVDLEVIWGIVVKNLPGLLEEIEPLIPPDPDA